MRVSDFDYDLPPGAIAQAAIEPRDTAKLLLTRDMSDHVFSDLPALLRPGDLLVVNRTRVRAARLVGRKPGTGGVVEVLLTRRVDDERWEALVRPARRLRPGSRIVFDELDAEILTGPEAGMVTLRLGGTKDVEELLAREGEVPLPPYFTGTLEDPERYQTIFAKTLGSAAAPTAALHFTPRLTAALNEAGISFAEVDLEVGLDTFRPMSVDVVEEHRIHTERYAVPEETVHQIDQVRRLGGRVVAVGTTVVRTLETAARGHEGNVTSGEGASSLFITPGYTFGVVDAMVTNFHAPRTTLIALVAAALGPAWREVYVTALARGYRFLSFGDAMVIEGLREL